MILRMLDISTKDHGEHHFQLPPNFTLGEFFDKDEKLRAVQACITRVAINGLERKEWRKASPGKSDVVSVEILPKDFGLGALVQIFQIISAIATVARFIISLFQQPQKPKAPGSDKSQTYTFEGIRDNFPPGDPVPIVYGHQRKGGQVLMYQVTMDADKKHQRLKMLLGLCEGEVSSIGAIELNNISVNDLTSFSYTAVLGTSSQGPISGFTEIANTFYDGREITNFNINRQFKRGVSSGHTGIVMRTANNNVTDMEVQVRAPSGLYTIGKNKGTIYPQWCRYTVEYKRSEHLFWTVVATRTLKAKGGLDAQRPIWDVYKFPFPKPDEYDVRLTWIDASGHPNANHPVGFEYRIELFNYTEFAGTMPVYSSTAMLAIQGVATQEMQGGQPTATAIVYGNKVKRYYTADSFDIGWSNNPAWAVRDYMTNSVYGMGAYVHEADLDMQSFLDFATLANSDVQFCAPSAPNPYEMAPGEVFYSRNAVTAIQGDIIQGSSIQGRFPSIGWNGPDANLQLTSREDGKPRYGIAYTHYCCPPLPSDRYAGPYGANSPDDWCDGGEVFMRYLGRSGGKGISGVIGDIRSGSIATKGTAYGLLYDESANTPCISFHRWNDQDMTSYGTIINSIPISVLTPGCFLYLEFFQWDFSTASGYYTVRIFGDVLDSSFSTIISVCDTAENTNRIPQNHDGLNGVIVLPSYDAGAVYASHYYNSWDEICGLCYSSFILEKKDHDCKQTTWNAFHELR